MEREFPLPWAGGYDVGVIYTIGHSTLQRHEFVDLLVANNINTVLDVRSHPGSHHVPDYNLEQMQEWLGAAGISVEWWPDLGGWTERDAECVEPLASYGVDVAAYTHHAFPKARIAKKIPEQVDPRCPVHGGVRREGVCSCDQRQDPIWNNYGFYDYSFYMGSDRYSQTIHRLAQIGRHNDVAIMCAELVWWRALEIAEPVLTPEGWVPMGQIKTGDLVIGSDGQATKVIAVPFRNTVPLFDVVLADNTSIRCSGDHLWTVEAVSGGVRKEYTLTTTELAARRTRTSARWSIRSVAPVHFGPQPDLPLDPYFLGVLLGDGSMYTVPDGHSTPRWFSNTADGMEILAQVQPTTTDIIKQRPHHASGNASVFMITGGATRVHLREVGIFGVTGSNKYVPESYLRAAPADRLAVLQGLMDTDGYVSAQGQCVQFYTSALRLAEGVAELARSLGGTARIWRGERMGNWKPRYHVSIRVPECPFRLSRKANRWRLSRQRFARTIRAITPVGEGEAQCITVDAPDGLFVARNYTLTHNCHRSMVADYLVALGHQVQHLQPKLQPHILRDRLARYDPSIIAAWGVETPQLLAPSPDRGPLQ